MKISIINGDGTTTYVENMTPVTSLEEFSDSLTSATQALNDSQTETNATFAGTSLTVPTDLMSIFEEAANTYGVDVNLLTAIAKQESNFTAVRSVPSCAASALPTHAYFRPAHRCSFPSHGSEC